jgi:hypothetical protein
MELMLELGGGPVLVGTTLKKHFACKKNCGVDK